MKIWVSSLELVHRVARDVQPSHVVSLLGPGSEFPDIEGFATPQNQDASLRAHHRVELDDIRKAMDGYLTPNEQHVENLIAFLEQWKPSLPLLVHCWAGISRSSATAYIAACMKNPDADEHAIAQEIATASPTAYPNTLIVSIADDMLKRGGRMAKAAENICNDEDRKAHLRSIENAIPFSIPAEFD